MPLSPPQRRHALHTPGNPSLTNADQTVTKVDARLTKVDTVNPLHQPQTRAKHGKTANLPTLSTPLSTLAVNPSGAPRTTLNKSEQIRTNPNTAKRPDQIRTLLGSPPSTQKKPTPNTAVARPQRPTPTHRGEG